MDKHDGGPAFPCPVGHIECRHPEGMTLRDYFAAKAMQVLADRYRDDTYICQESYDMADAMLKARDAT